MKKTIYILIAGCLLSACASYKNLYVPDANYLERRNVETRIFDTTNTKELLIASAQLLQDMGYTITESDIEIGVITASKTREKGSTAGKAVLTFLAALNGQPAIYEDTQKFYVSIVNTKANDKQIKTRVTFARIIYNNLGTVVKIEKLDDTNLYTEFFDKLSQSVFLTANNI
jgi:uncharacterized protein YlxP (DUF503 family)